MIYCLSVSGVFSQQASGSHAVIRGILGQKAKLLCSTEIRDANVSECFVDFSVIICSTKWEIVLISVCQLLKSLNKINLILASF